MREQGWTREVVVWKVIFEEKWMILYEASVSRDEVNVVAAGVDERFVSDYTNVDRT